jgi:hypothetical protein
MWTVAGAVAASVLTAGILGGASGILQVPAMVNEITGLRTSRDQANVTLASLSERIRSAELVAESQQRELNDITSRLMATSGRIDKADGDSRQFQIDTQKELAALEGRSKDRNTEVHGDIGTLRSAIDAHGDRLKALTDALNLVRQNVYDLAARMYKQPMSTPQSFPQLPESPSFHPPWNGVPGAPDREQRDAAALTCWQPHEQVGKTDRPRQRWKDAVLIRPHRQNCEVRQCLLSTTRFWGY